MDDIENLVETLALEPIEVNLFRAEAPADGRRAIFGGHVIAQALLAAYETVQGRDCHSLHAYFIRPGDPNIPILYEVDRARDGSSFTTRRVKAIQHGAQIFNLSASFQVAEEGFEHQTPAPQVPPPEGLPIEYERLAARGFPVPGNVLAHQRPIERRSTNPINPGEKDEAVERVWTRARVEIGYDQRLHQAILAYASDLGLLGVGMRPHGFHGRSPGLHLASLDHAMWFHRPLDFNDWHLFVQDSPVAAGARSFVRAQVFSRDGAVVASVAQEGLMRQRPPA